MGVSFVRKPKPAVPEGPKEYTILDALKEFETHKGTLMLVHKVSGECYKVLSYDPKTGQTMLKGSRGEKLKPRVAERECANWEPMWR
jgi:hypothetical protein